MPHDPAPLPELLQSFIKWADKSFAVTWAGTGGLKDRLENPHKFPKDKPFTASKQAELAADVSLPALKEEVALIHERIVAFCEDLLASPLTPPELRELATKFLAEEKQPLASRGE